MTPQEAEIFAKVEVLADLEPVVHDLMVVHEAKRVLWFPSELLAPAPDTDPDAHLRELRSRADGISIPARVALALPTDWEVPSEYRRRGVAETIVRIVLGHLSNSGPGDERGPQAGSGARQP